MELARKVASFTDAWIETEAEAKSILVTMSHLLQMRGLKQQDQKYDDAQRMSHLLQMRGLKPLFKGAFERVFNVASFTGTTIYNIFCKKITGLKYLFVRK